MILKEGEPLISLIIMSSAETIDPDSYLFMPKNQSTIKTIGHDGGHTIRGYKVEKTESHMAYLRQTGKMKLIIIYG